MKIKMSDVFELPMHASSKRVFDQNIFKIGKQGVMIHTLQSDILAEDVDNAIVTAINAYDANQQEIAELKEKLVSQQLAHDEEITNIEDVNNSMSKLVDAKINMLAQERDELKAQVNELRKSGGLALDDMIMLFAEQKPSHSDGSYSVDGQSCHDLQFAIESSPAQCLASVKADLLVLTRNEILIASSHAELKQDDIISFLDDLIEQANKLSEAK